MAIDIAAKTVDGNEWEKVLAGVCAALGRRDRWLDRKSLHRSPVGTVNRRSPVHPDREVLLNPQATE
jgi:hypothetical protein